MNESCRVSDYIAFTLVAVIALFSGGEARGATGAAPPTGGVAFPGPDAGPADAVNQDQTYTLQNRVMSATWRFDGTALGCTDISNRITGAHFDQRSTELFRLATHEQKAAATKGVDVAIRLDADKVVAMISPDRVAWQTLATFPRSEFSGEPKLVRIGKMNLTGQAADNPGDLGEAGECEIADLRSDGTALGPPFDIKAKAHQAAVRDVAFPAASRLIACRIDKGTDKGQSWGPALALVWKAGEQFIVLGVRDGKGSFNIETSAGQRIAQAEARPYPRFDLLASAFHFAHPPTIVRVAPQAGGTRVADRAGGAALEADATSDDGVKVHWRAELRDGSNYVREVVTFSSDAKTVPLTGIELGDLHVPDVETVGTCPGCPVVGSGLFAGVELPGAQNAVGPGTARIGFSCKLELSPKQSYSFGKVVGVWPQGQLRRSFLYYVERERARPSKPFLNYNCWYDLGFGVSEPTMLDAASAFHRELVERRGVPVQSYLIDDGWDDPNRGLWAESRHKFPGGLPRLGHELEALGSHLGVWISPLGGYGGDKERTADARKMGIIPPTGEMDLSYPGYKQWFQDRCTQLMRESGVNAFKWDRAGNGVTPHFLALLDVAHHLRAVNPDVFINVTVGTWPSPFWLNHVDTTWRNASAGDVSWAGKGNDPGNPVHGRERWITFRDGACRACFVVPSPLYPLNSVMHDGIVHGREFQGKDVGRSGPDLRHEARSYFGTGAMLQELYLTPSMMNAQGWDDVADAARWAHANADVLADAHWVGGDPLKLEPYGYAAWNRRKATLMLRNPDDQPRTMGIDVARDLDLPSGAATEYRVSSPYPDAPSPISTLVAGKSRDVTLKPFEVVVLDLYPVR